MSNRPWAALEDEILRRVYPRALDMEPVLAALPGRSVRSIAIRASRLGIKKTPAVRSRINQRIQPRVG